MLPFRAKLRTMSFGASVTFTPRVACPTIALPVGTAPWPAGAISVGYFLGRNWYLLAATPFLTGPVLRLVLIALGLVVWQRTVLLGRRAS